MGSNSLKSFNSSLFNVKLNNVAMEGMLKKLLRARWKGGR